MLVAGCASKQPGVEDLEKHETLPQFKLGSLRGTRDGDHLQTQAMFTDSSSILTMDMRFAIGSPTTLEAGAWRWTKDNGLTSGTVTGRSVVFLGGQDGPPSVGGTFDLVGSDGAARYRVTIPVTQMQARLKPAR